MEYFGNINFANEFYINLKSSNRESMSLEKDIIQLLERFRDTQCAGKAYKAAEHLGVPPATFSRWITGTNLPKVESLILPFERLNARIVLGESEDNEDLKKQVEELNAALVEQKLYYSDELIKAKTEIIELQRALQAASLKNEPQKTTEKNQSPRPAQPAANAAGHKN